MIKDENVILK